jgi:general secretion pathway protein H
MSSHNNQHITRGKSRGFTLLELLVVVLIIGLISALVMPRIAASLPGVQLKSTARAVAASLRYARSQAVFESIPYMAVFDNSQKRLAVEPMEKPLAAAESDSLRVILNESSLQKVYEFPDEVEFAVSNNSDADEGRDLFPIFFFPRGDSTGGTIVLKNVRGKHFTITVDPITGAVEIDRS